MGDINSPTTSPSRLQNPLLLGEDEWISPHSPSPSTHSSRSSHSLSAASEAINSGSNGAMLARNSFLFETPNVIDPGETPPSIPSRLLQQTNSTTASSRVSHEGHSPNREDVDLLERGTTNYCKPQLSQGVKIMEYRINDYSTGSDDENEEYDDACNGDSEDDHDQLPSVEQARMFAAAMLTESERRDSQRTLDPYIKSRTVTLSSPKLLQDRRRRFYRNLCVIAMVCTVAAFVTVAITGSHHSRNEVNTDRMQSTINLLSGNSISDRTALNTVGTPQNKAANWIANVDPMHLDVPTSLSSDPFPFLQRYALATLYYALGGDLWINQLNFVTGDHECSWFQSMPDASGEPYAIGVTCDATLRVKNLLIRELKN